MLYFDGHATTPCDPRVVEAMLPFFTERFGNASSRQHAFGWAANEAVEEARGHVAALIGARPKDIVFTSGATEADNLAIGGLARARRDGRRHIVTVATEHAAVLDVCAALERDGWSVTRLPVDRDGLLDPDRLRAALQPDTVVVSVMAANNEIGVLQPLARIGSIVRSHGAAFHTDAAQAAGKVPVDVEAIGADLVSISAHKMYGPKGIGALYVRRRGPAAGLGSVQYGGGQERGLRPGTLNVPGIVGFGAAARMCGEGLAGEAAQLRALRDRLLDGLRAGIDGLRVNGSMSSRLPHNLNVAIPGVDGRRLLMGLSDIGVSSGAACSAASAEASHVLLALGLAEEEAKASLRFGLIRGTNAADVDAAIARVVEVVAGLRDRR